MTETIPFHQAKQIIERELEAYRGNGTREVKLHHLEIERKGSETHLKFEIEQQTSVYKVAKALVEGIGSMNVESSFNDLTLRCEEVYVHFFTSFDPHVSVTKKGDLTSQEIEAIISAYKIGNSIAGKKPPREVLHDLGVSIYEPKPGEWSWDYLAGYDRVKQEIKDTVILPLQHPEVYEQIAQQTRKKYENIRPKAVLFEGPPGTGKTTCARIIAGEAGCSLVHVPIESIMTKWYGESEKRLAKIFNSCRELGDLILFLDEIDSLGISREGNIHEASRRILSVLLRKIDGFEADDKTILIGATNRKQDLDAALLSRFDVSIYFHLPNAEERTGIFQNYAKHLNPADLETLAKKSEELSGRNIKDVCEHAERRWASRRISGEVKEDVPNLMEYLASLKARKTNGLQ